MLARSAAVAYTRLRRLLSTAARRSQVDGLGCCGGGGAWHGAVTALFSRRADMMAASLTIFLSPAATVSRLRMWVAGREKGCERREVMRWRRRRRFLQLKEKVPGPSTSVSGRRRLRHGLGCSDGAASGKVTTASPEGTTWVKARDGSSVVGKRDGAALAVVAGVDALDDAGPGELRGVDFTLDTESVTSERAGLRQPALLPFEISNSLSPRPGIEAVWRSAASSSAR
jgi:hypothetical protein